MTDYPRYAARRERVLSCRIRAIDEAVCSGQLTKDEGARLSHQRKLAVLNRVFQRMAMGNPRR